MTAKKIKHTVVDRNKYKIYLKKASEFYQSMIARGGGILVYS